MQYYRRTEMKRPIPFGEDANFYPSPCLHLWLGLYENARTKIPRRDNVSIMSQGHLLISLILHLLARERLAPGAREAGR